MAVRNLEAVQQLSGPAVRAESRPGRIGPISLGAKQTGERRAGNPHAAFDVAGTGNVAWSRCCDTRRRKGETTGNTNIDLNRRASPRSVRRSPSCNRDRYPARVTTQATKPELLELATKLQRAERPAGPAPPSHCSPGHQKQKARHRQ